MPPCFWYAKPPTTHAEVLKALQSPENPEFLFSVTAGDNNNCRGGYCMLCAVYQGKGVRYMEEGYARYEAILNLSVLAASKIGMVDHQSGAVGDTHLMKAAANGNDRAVFYLLTAGARDSHLG